MACSDRVFHSPGGPLDTLPRLCGAMSSSSSSSSTSSRNTTSSSRQTSSGKAIISSGGSGSTLRLPVLARPAAFQVSVNPAVGPGGVVGVISGFQIGPAQAGAGKQVA